MTDFDQGPHASSAAATPSGGDTALLPAPVSPANSIQARLWRNRPIRVLVVSPRFLPDLGGVETHIFRPHSDYPRLQISR